MTAAPGSRIPLVLADSVLSSFLAAHSEQRGDDNSRLHPNVLCPGPNHTGIQRT